MFPELYRMMDELREAVDNLPNSHMIRLQLRFDGLSKILADALIPIIKNRAAILYAEKIDKEILSEV